MFCFVLSLVQNYAIDAEVLLSGDAQIVLSVETNKGDREIDLSDVLNVQADVFVRAQEDESLFMASAEVSVALGDVCDMSDAMSILCEIFEEGSTSFEGTLRAYAGAGTFDTASSSDFGFGVKLDLDAQLEFQSEFEFLEDILPGWPNDGQVDVEFSTELEDDTLKTCVGFDGNTACVSSCTKDSDCGDSYWCSPFKFCVKDLPNGTPCYKKKMCESNTCYGVCI